MKSVPYVPLVQQVGIPQPGQIKQVLQQNFAIISDKDALFQTIDGVFRLRSEAFNQNTPQAFLEYFQQVAPLAESLRISFNDGFCLKYDIFHVQYKLELAQEPNVALLQAAILLLNQEDYEQSLQLIARLMKSIKAPNLHQVVQFIQFYASILHIQQRQDLQKYKVEETGHALYDALISQMLQVENMQKIIYNCDGALALEIDNVAELVNHIHKLKKQAKELQDDLLKNLFAQHCPRFLKQRLGINLQYQLNQLLENIPEVKKNQSQIFVLHKEAAAIATDHHKRYCKLHTSVMNHNDKRIQELLAAESTNIQQLLEENYGLKTIQKFQDELQSFELAKDTLSVAETKLKARLGADDLAAEEQTKLAELQQQVNSIFNDLAQSQSSAYFYQVVEQEKAISQLQNKISDLTQNVPTLFEFVQDESLTKLSKQLLDEDNDLLINEYLKQRYLLVSADLGSLIKLIRAHGQLALQTQEETSFTSFQQKIEEIMTKI